MTAVLTACSSAAAQDEATTYEITPFAAYRFGGDFEVDATDQDVDLKDHRSFALALNLRADEARQYELFYARQSTDLDGEFATPMPTGIEIEYLHLGGTVLLHELLENRRVKPYIVGTLGASRLTPDAPDIDDSTHFSFAFGAGLRIPVNERFSLRFEARGYATLMDTDSALFCSSDETGGLCAIRARASTFIQYDLLAGAAVAF